MAKEIRIITRRYNKKFRKKWDAYIGSGFERAWRYEQADAERIDALIRYEPNRGVWAKDRKRYVDEVVNSRKGMVAALNGFLAKMGFTERLKLDVECYRKRLYKKYEVKE